MVDIGSITAEPILINILLEVDSTLPDIWGMSDIFLKCPDELALAEKIPSPGEDICDINILELTGRN